MIKEMDYTSVVQKGKVLYRGTYKDIMIMVISFGTHPCGYLLFDKNHYMYGKNEEQADDIVSVHGGFSFCSEKPLALFNGVKLDDKWVLGFDYAHAGDRFGDGVPGIPDDKRWTTEEIISECREYIDTIVLKTPANPPLERNPLLDVLSSEITKSGREIFEVRSQEPVRDYPCRLRLFRDLKDVTHKTIEKLKNVKLFITKCKYCGIQFVTNSKRCEICSDECTKKNENEVTKKYMQKYMARNRKKFGYSFSWYYKNRKEVLKKAKERLLKKSNRSESFVCKVCGKVCKYLEGYHLRSVVCKNPKCRSTYYRRKK